MPAWRSRVFESLSERLQGVFSRLRNKGVITEKDVDEALREVRVALLEADVNFKVAKEFLARVRERALWAPRCCRASIRRSRSSRSSTKS